MSDHNLPVDSEALKTRIVEVLKTIYDPEIPVSIYEMGLIYGLEIDGHNAVKVRMTLTAPNCPVAESLPAEVEAKCRAVRGVGDVQIELVWDPPWSVEMMSEAARLTLGL